MSKRIINGRVHYYDNAHGYLIGVGSAQGGRNRLNDDERVQIVDGIDAGEPAVSIALRIGCSSRTVYRLRDALGMTEHRQLSPGNPTAPTKGHPE